MKDKILEQIISFILITVFAFFGNVGFNYLFRDKGVVRIGYSMELEKGKYEIPIDIYNFEDSSLDNIKIKIMDNIDIDRIKTSEILNIKKELNNMNSNTSSIFEISKVNENKKMQMIFITTRKVESKDIEIIKNGNRIKVEYPDDIKSPIKEQLLTALMNALIYAIILSIFQYYMGKRDTKVRKDMEEQVEELKSHSNHLTSIIDKEEKDFEKIANKNNKLGEELEEYKQYVKKREILLLARIRDYSKELNYWRDTIRSILYKSKNNNINVDVVFDMVTKNLKTYQVKENKEPDFETLKVLSGILNTEMNGSKSK